MRAVVFALSHSEPAGAQAIWADLAHAFRQRGYDASLLAIYPGKAGALPLRDGVAWTYCLDHPVSSGLDALRALRGAARRLRSAAPAAIITALPAANAVFPVANRLCGGLASVFVSHHSPISTYNPGISRLEGLVGATNAVDGVVCVSEAVRSSLSGRSGRYRAKARVIRNALPPDVEARVEGLRPYALGKTAGRKVVASGRLAAQKNYPVLIRAMAYVEDAACEIIGAGPDEAALQELAAECGVAHAVTFSGLKSRDDTLAAVAAADLFVQPSLFEGHSLALVEAAKLGLPLIVSDVPSQTEAVTRRDQTVCAMTHSPEDSAALARAISLLLGNASLREHYSALSRSLGEETSFSAMVDGYEALLRRGP